MKPVSALPLLSESDRKTYEWQLPVTGFGEEGQRKLKAASVLISRCGGLGGVVAYELAAAGVGQLVLAHGGNVKPSDLNRQILMTHDWIGKPRVECAARRLRELNPQVEILAVAENVNEANAERLVNQTDVVVDCAPLFEERYLLNRESVRQRKPLVECSVYELEAHLTTLVPGRGPCLRCLYPEKSPAWKRQFPVFGAVPGTVGCLAAMEAIKLLAGFGQPLIEQMLTCDLLDMTFRKFQIRRDPHCSECGQIEPIETCGRRHELNLG
jgi:molybdopterin/thiamine biosynthesis adenylyltransferase